MARKKLLTISVCVGFFMMACNFGGLLTPKETETPTLLPSEWKRIPLSPPQATII